MIPLSPPRIFIPRSWPHVSAALFMTLGGSSVLRAGDLLRGGGTTAVSPSRALTAGGGNEAGAVQAAQARANAHDALARTTQAIAAVQQMQAQARALAAGQNSAGAGLPAVPNGLGAGGLQPAAGIAGNPGLWSGADLPAQTATDNGGIKVTVKQNAQQALLNWDSFNVGRQTELYFDQTAGGANRNQWIAFNTVNDPSGVPSQILGSIKAEGQVYVINQNGIIFGGASEVNTHTLVASSLPLNTNLVERGLLNNPDKQFLFSALPQPAGSKGTPAFTPPAPTTANGRPGDVTVQAGAKIFSPASADKVGGRVALIGPNVHNAGHIETPDGQTILAAGLQVGMVAHDTNDPTLRGLDVYVGAVTDPASVIPGTSGSAVNSGLISALRASVSITGKDVKNTGAIDSSTSVSLNGRIDLQASYDAISSSEDVVDPFLNQKTGTVTLGEGSVMRVLPEQSLTEKVVGTKLALNSKVNITGKTVHLEENSTLLAPSADVQVETGVWKTIANRPVIVNTEGQIYLDNGAMINVAGSIDVPVPVSQNFVKAELRAAELADSPLLRNSPLRGQTVIVDIRNTGTYNGKAWVGSPIADVSGYANLIERSARELTIAGGSVNLNTGGQVVMQQGSTIDVSNGWIQYTGASVQTTRVMSGGRVLDISQATPDRIYDGIYTGAGAANHDAWGLTDLFPNPAGPDGEHQEDGGLFGGAGGTLTLSGASMAIDGALRGLTVAGPRQRSVLPAASKLIFNFEREKDSGSNQMFSPTPPSVTFRSDGTLPAAGPFTLDEAGNPAALPAERVAEVFLNPSLFTESGFRQLTVNNSDGDITVPQGVHLNVQAPGGITLAGANVTVNGTIIAPGGAVNLSAFTISPSVIPDLPPGTAAPSPDAGRGTVSLGSAARIDTSGLLVDDRLFAENPLGMPLVLNGGSISINGYHTILGEGSVLNVSGGAGASSRGSIAYGSGGTITLRGGQDPNLATVDGGTLDFGAVMTGYSGTRGGTLSITAPAVQVGGTGAGPRTLHLDPSFFSEGGFTSYALTGTGTVNESTGQLTPGVFIAPGTEINPVAESWLASINGPGGALSLGRTTYQEGVRTPVSLSFNAAGVRDLVPVRGDLVFGEGAVIRTDARASVTLRGDTAAIHGSVYAPGGSITIAGGTDSQTLFNDPTVIGRTTTLIGENSVLSTAGKVLLAPDVRDFRVGQVLAGGTVSISGNIAAEAGAVIDVSGTSGELDVPPGSVTGLDPGNTSLTGSEMVRTRIDSNGGTINLTGGQHLFMDATLRGHGGGAGAEGGTLRVSSGRPLAANALTPTLHVVQSGLTMPGGGATIGTGITGTNGLLRESMGYIIADTINNSGLTAVTLAGSVRFDGPVALTASRSLSVATAGVIRANDAVTLTSAHVALGQPFAPPLTATELQTYSPFKDGTVNHYFPPATGTGSLTVNAKLIDVGNLSLQGIGSASLLAGTGDIRGNGTLNIAGEISMQAGQIYPATGSTFTIAAYNYQKDGAAQSGKVSITGGGTRSLPWSAGGTLNIYASVIEQRGTLRAPAGTINLGWDGTGTAPVDPITNQAVPRTEQLTLGSGSITSVSQIDPVTHAPILLPFGLNAGGTAWIDPSGTDITRTGPPSKGVNLAGDSVDAEEGSTVDIRGGGELYAYRWIQGNGGTRDVLNSTTSFAIVPGYSADYAPYASFNTGTAASSLGGDPGYANNTLTPGDQIYLNGTESVPGSDTTAGIPGLAAGVYTLLPARYALLPGAFLITPKSGTPGGAVLNPDNSSVTSGYRFSDSRPAGTNVLLSNYEVAPSVVIRTRSQYEDYRAGDFFTRSAASAGTTPPRLPADAGRLALTAAQQLTFSGSLSATAPQDARGGLVDISSPVDIVIAGPETEPVQDALVLKAEDLSAFNAQSLLIGGLRQPGAGGTQVTVKTGNLTVDNAGSPLNAQDLILVSSNSLTLAPGAEIVQNGSGSADTLLFGDAAVAGSGNGALVRVSGDPDADIVRRGTSVSDATLTVGTGVRLQGASLTLDSTSATVLDTGADLRSDAIRLNSGRISLALDDPGTLQEDAGLILSGAVLNDLQAASALSFLSYSSLDIYGTGTVGRAATNSLELHAGEIRGFNNEDGTASFTAKNILIDNAGNGTAPASGEPAEGTLALNAETVSLGVNSVRISQFDRLEVTASRSVLATASGALLADGDVRIHTPVITGSTGAAQTIQAAGALEIDAPAGGSSTAAGGLGASLTLRGTSVSADSSILLPSGDITLHAVTGDVNVTGRLDAGGVSRQFYDLTKYTDAGRVTLTADAGNVNVQEEASVSVAAHSGGGNAGTLNLSARGGSVNIDGALDGTAGNGGKSGTVNVVAEALPSLAEMDSTFNEAHFNESRSYRAITGNVSVDGSADAHRYNVSADSGDIAVTGTIDSSGTTGGHIALQANGSVTLSPQARLSARGEKFDSAGKGGSVLIETGAQTNGTARTDAVLDVQAGSVIDLSVAAQNANSAAAGQVNGTLHLRAPQNADGTDVQMNAVAGTVTGASSIVVEGYKVYDLASTGGTIDTTVQDSVRANGTTFGNAAGAIRDRLFAGSPARDLAGVQTGAEIINPAGDLTLESTWDLSTFRFGPDNAPGILTMRAAGDLNFDFATSLSDGFGGGAAALPLWKQPLLAAGTRSWSYRLTAGADLSAADFRAVQSLDSLAADSGSLVLGSNGTGQMPLPTNYNASTVRDSIITPRYQTIRTGTGDITITAGRDVQILNPLGTIYTAGTQAAAMANFDTPDTSYSGTGAANLGTAQHSGAPYAAQYSLNGGNVSVSAQQDIARYRPGTTGELLPDSTKQMPANWLYRRGYVDPVTGQFTATRTGGDVGSTSWWIDFSNFFEGVGALGGGHVTMTAGRDVANVDAVIPTNARMPKGAPNAGALLELGGGDLTVRAGRDIDGGVYYVERGQGTIAAGDSIKTNSTRATLTQGFYNDLIFQGLTPDPTSWLPTTLFAGKAVFDVTARGDLLLGQTVNPFLLPQGINNSFHQKTYFTTYGQTSAVNVSSLGGNLTLQNTADGENPGTLQAWYDKVLKFGTDTWSRPQPWLRLAETEVLPFTTAFSLSPGTLRATAFSGNLNLAGSITLSPSTTGTVDLAAAGNINGLRPVSQSSLTQSYEWGGSTINLSDTDPNGLPGIIAPLTLPGFSAGNVWRLTPADVMTTLDLRFLESGSTVDTYAVLQTKQALHAAGLLHRNDPDPVRFYSSTGSISGLTLFSGKAGRILAGNDIRDASFYLQNVRSSDVSIISSGRDIIAYDLNSPLRTEAQSPGNVLITTTGRPNAGDFFISGPGTLEVLAGRHLDLGVGPNNPDRTALGLMSIGNARNPALPFEGADIVAGAGLGAAGGFTNPNVDFEAFITKYVTAPTEIAGSTHYYVAELLGNISFADFMKLPEGERTTLVEEKLAQFNALNADDRKLVAMDVFYRVLRDTGRGRAITGDYAVGEEAIKVLFKGSSWTGDIALTSRQIKTQSGGNISIFAPGGKLTVGLDATGAQALDQGILTESGGAISIFTHNSVAVGTSRIFTLRGGDEIIWSSEGDIAAGASSKTVQSAPPTRVLIDPQSGDVKTDLAGLATGGGIGVLATVAGVAPGNVDLIAPKGTIDAGDAGIRVTGNINIAAANVVNGGNIAAGGTSSGAPAAPSSGGAAAAAAPPPPPPQKDTATQTTSADQRPDNKPAEQLMASLINVEVVSYGGGGNKTEEEDEEERKRREQEQEESENGDSNKPAEGSNPDRINSAEPNQPAPSPSPNNF